MPPVKVVLIKTRVSGVGEPPFRDKLTISVKNSPETKHGEGGIVAGQVGVGIWSISQVARGVLEPCAVSV